MKVWLGSNKIYVLRKLLTQEEVIHQAEPKVVKRFTVDNPFQESDIRFGQILVDNEMYAYSEYYTSVFQLEHDEVKAYMDANEGSLDGFTNTNPQVTADWFIADFDHESGIKGIIIELTKILMYLELNKIPYYLFASGKKGVHLYIPMQAFSFPDKFKDKMHIVMDSIADWFEKEFKLPKDFIDRIYDPVRMIRYPFSLHPKSGLIKTLCFFKADKFKPTSPVGDYLDIQEDSITEETAEVFKKILFNPYDGVVPFKIDIEVKEKPVYENSPADVVNKLFLTPRHERQCVYTMLNATNIKGQRRRIALILIFWMKEKGLPEDMAFKFLEYWSSKLIDPLTHDELLDVMKYYGRYSRNCQDPTMRSYCPESKVCPYWNEELLQRRVVTLESALEQTREMANESNATRMWFNEFLKDFPAYASSKFGHIIAIGSASGVGKTWLALNMVAKIKRMNFLIFSHEQSRYELLLRLASLYGLDINDPDESRQLLDNLSNVYIDDSGATTLGEQIKVKQAIEKEHGIKIHWIIVDYIQLVRVEDPNNPSKYVADPTMAMVEVSKVIKTLAKQEECGYIFLSQVPKEKSGNGNTMITEEDLKDSQALQACSDVIITLWRPNKKVHGAEDNILSVFMCKHKHTKFDNVLRRYTFEEGLIGDEHIGLVEERKRL